MSQLLVVAAALCLVLAGPQLRSRADDEVFVSRNASPGESRRRGTIVEFTGQTLTLRLVNGRDEQIETKRVVRYATELVPDQQQGDALFAARRYADAVVSYRRAMELEKRTWVRRVILVQMVRCYKNADQVIRAGDTFQLVVRSDPTTQFLDAAPMTWTSTPPAADLIERSNRWIEKSDAPIMRLVGASWLLATVQRPRALEVMKQLAGSSDPRVALLAEAQLWRERMITATLDDAQRWRRQLEALDEPLRGGPYFVIGQVLARHGRNGEAALAFLRVPILHPEQCDLSAEALFAAGEQLEKMGDRSGARRVYRELAQTCKTHRLAPAAEQRLERLGVN